MKKVLLRGPVLTQSGYGVHCRQIARWLLSKNNIDLKFQATPWGDTPWLVNPDYQGGLVGRIMDRTVDPTGTKFDVSVQLQLPNEWDPNIASYNVGVSALVETDKCNPAWVSAANRMDRVIVPSKHAADCLTASGEVTKPLSVIPESFSDSVLVPQKTDIFDFSTSFNFLLFGQLTGNSPVNDRKNIYNTVKWFCETFANDPEVGLVIKTNSGRNTMIDQKVVTGILSSIIHQCRRGAFPRIHLLHGELSDDEVAALYRHPKIKAYISLTRGEGYGLPTLEAAASGLPVIATGWSGHMDYLNVGKFINVGYRLVDVHPSRIDGSIFVKGSKWAEPSEDDFKKRISKFRTNSDVPKQWALDLESKLSKTHDFESIARQYDELLGSAFT